MKHTFLRWVSALLAAAMLMHSTGGLVAMAAEPTPMPTATATMEPTPTPTAEATTEPSTTPTATATMEPTPTPTATATTEPSATPAATATVEPSATPVPDLTEESETSSEEPAEPFPEENPISAAVLSLPEGMSYVEENPNAPVEGMEDINELMRELGEIMRQPSKVAPDELREFAQLADEQAQAISALMNAPATLSEDAEPPELPLTLVPNDWSKVEFLSPAVSARTNSVSAEGTVLVVDDSCMVVQVLDESGNQLSGATVTVQRDNGSISTNITGEGSQGISGAAGIAVIQNLQNVSYCKMDVQATGYQTQTYPEIQLETKSMMTIQLKPISNAEPYYIRSADLSGADIIRGDVSLDLVPKAEDSADSKLTILLSRNPNVTSWPTGTDALTLAAKGDKKESGSPLGDDELRVVSSVGNGLTESAEPDENTRLYTQTAKWNQRGIGLLRGGDELSLRFAGLTVPLSRVSVRNAIVSRPTARNFQLSLFGGVAAGGTSTSSVTIKNTGTFLDDSSINATLPKVPATLMMLPNGTYFLAISLGGDTLYVPEEFGVDTKPLDPNQQKKAENYLQSVNKLWNKKVDAYLNGRARMKDGSFFKLMSSHGSSITLSGMLGVLGGYNRDTGRLEGVLSGAFSFSGKYNQTGYLVFGLMPVYAGFELGASGGVNGSFGVATKVPAGYEQTEEFAKLFNQMSILFSPERGYIGDLALSVGLALSLYAGIGIKGVAALQGELYGSLNLTNTLYAADEDPTHSYPHLRLGSTLSGTVRVVALLFTASKTWYLAKDTTLYDSWSRSRAAFALAALPQNEDCMVSLDLDALSEASLGTSSYTADAGPVLLSANANGASTAADDVLADNQLQIVRTANKAAVFRLASVGGKPRLVWQSMNTADGSLESEVNVLDTPDVFSYAVTANATQNTDATSQDNVYITLITGDFDKGDTPEQRAATTGVRGITLNLKTGDVLFDQQVREPDGAYCHSPQAAGAGNLCNPMWIESKTFTFKANTGTLRRWNGDKAGITRIGTIKNSMLSTGLVGEGQPCLLRVSWSGTGLRLRAYDSNGRGVQGMECMLPIDTGTLSETESQNLLEHVYVSGNCLYLVSAGRLVRLVWNTDGTLTAESAKNTDGTELHIGSGQGSYALSVLPESSNHCGNLITLVHRVDEQGNAANVVKNQFFYDTENLPFTIHTAQEYQLPDSSTVGGFAVLTHPGSNLNSLSGLSLVYNADVTTNAAGTVSQCDVRRWHKELDRDLTAEEVYLPMAVVKRGQTGVELQVLITNNGGQTEDQVWLKAWDEHGDLIHLNNESGQDGTVAYGLSPALAPGESQWLTLTTFTALNCWTIGAHSIRVQASCDGTFPAALNSRTVPTVSAQVKMDQPMLTLSGDLVSYGDRKLVDLTITNESTVPVNFADLKLMQIAYDGDGEPDPSETAQLLLDFYALGSDRQLTDCKEELENNQWREHSYTTTLDVSEAMKDHRYLLLYLTIDKDGGTDSVTAHGTLMLENPDKDPAFQHIGTEVARPLTGTTAGDKGLIQGASTDLTATAAGGFRFAGWQDESGAIVSTDNPLHVQCTDCAEDHRTFTAVFEDAGSHLLTLNADPAQGTVQVEGVSDTQTISDGTVYTAPDDAALTLSVTPAAGKRFVGWQENGAIVSADAPLTLTLTASRTLTAVFEDATAAQASDSRVQAQSGLRDDDLPEGMTVQQAQTALHDALAGRLALEGSALYSVQLQMRQNNGQWQPVDGELAEPVTVTLTLPEGVNARQQTIVVAHMRTIDSMEGDAGSIEFPAVTVISEREVQVTVSSLSPFAAGWSAAPQSEHPEIGEAIRNGTWGVDDTPTAKATGAIPRTSDDSPLLLWVALLGISLAGLVLLVIRKRRRK